MRKWRTEFKILFLLSILFFGLLIALLFRKNYFKTLRDDVRARGFVSCTKNQYKKGISYTEHTCTIRDDKNNSYTISYPQIDAKTKDIQTINSRLKTEFDAAYRSVKYYHQSEKLFLNAYTSVNYRLYYNNDIVSFIISNEEIFDTWYKSKIAFTTYNISASTYEVLSDEEIKEMYGIDLDFSSDLRAFIIELYAIQFRYDYNNELSRFRNDDIDVVIGSITYDSIKDIFIDDEGYINFYLYLYDPELKKEIPYLFQVDKSKNIRYEKLEY